MPQQKLISIDLRADAGFLKKPDHNEGLLLSYNMLHKPALLGILGAVIGLQGYQKKGELPQYYEMLKALPTGIAPLEGSHEKGNFIKSSVKYSNTVGYANKDGNLLIEESMLLKPAYRCYMLLDMENEQQALLYEYLKEGKAEYIPYLGKNEYQASWMNEEGDNTFQEYSYEKGARPGEKLMISSLIKKTFTLKDSGGTRGKRTQNVFFSPSIAPNNFAYFERLPAEFNEELMQYQMEEYIYTNFPIKQETLLPDLYYLPVVDLYVQLN